MQKQIGDFITINAPLPSDLFLISHVGETANMTLNTVATYVNSQILGTINYLTSNVSALTSLEKLNVTQLNSTINTLTAASASLSGNQTQQQLASNSLSANFISLSSSLVNLKASIPTFVDYSSSINQLSSLGLKLDSNNLLLSSSFLELSASLLKLPTYTDYSSAINTLSTSNAILSASCSNFSVQITGLSSSLISNLNNVDSLSAFVLALSSGSDLIRSDIQLLSTTSISNFSSVITLSSSVDALASYIGVTTPNSPLPISRIIFDTTYSSGGSREVAEEIDISKAVICLDSGYYILPAAPEGQILHFVPQTSVAGDFATQVYIENARYWIMSGGQKTSIEGPLFWVPWSLVMDNLDPYDGILPSVATAIYTGGAWNLSQGGRAHSFYQQGSNIGI